MNSSDKAIRYYHPELDALRFFAFLLVFFHHLIPQDAAVYTAAIFQNNRWLIDSIAFFGKAAGVGLPIFFCLSAYLIATLLIQERGRTGSVHLKSFYIRRILRIWPLYYFALLFTLAIALYQHNHHDVLWTAASAFFVTNWFNIFYHSSEAMQTPFYPLWSISVEEQFYVVFPLLLLLIKGNAVEKIAYGTVAVSLSALFIEGTMHLQTDRALYGNSLSQAIFFGVGILLATKLGSSAFQPSTVTRLSLCIGSLLLFACGVKFCNFMGSGPAQSGIVVAAGYALAAAGCAALMTGVYGTNYNFPKPVVYLGKISFGLYVFHIVSMQFLAHEAIRLHLHDISARLVSLLLTIVLAMLSYNYIEKPFLKIKNRFAFVESRPD